MVVQGLKILAIITWCISLKEVMVGTSYDKEVAGLIVCIGITALALHAYKVLKLVGAAAMYAVKEGDAKAKKEFQERSKSDYLDDHNTEKENQAS